MTVCTALAHASALAPVPGWAPNVRGAQCRHIGIGKDTGLIDVRRKRCCDILCSHMCAPVQKQYVEGTLMTAYSSAYPCSRE